MHCNGLFFEVRWIQIWDPFCLHERSCNSGSIWTVPLRDHLHKHNTQGYGTSTSVLISYFSLYKQRGCDLASQMPLISCCLLCQLMNITTAWKIYKMFHLIHLSEGSWREIQENKKIGKNKQLIKLSDIAERTWFDFVIMKGHNNCNLLSNAFSICSVLSLRKLTFTSFNFWWKPAKMGGIIYWEIVVLAPNRNKPRCWFINELKSKSMSL